MRARKTPGPTGTRSLQPSKKKKKNWLGALLLKDDSAESSALIGAAVKQDLLCQHCV